MKLFQDKRLKNYVKMYKENWERIAAEFADRSDVQCQQRWTKVVNPELVKGPWTKEVRFLSKYEFKNFTASSMSFDKEVNLLRCYRDIDIYFLNLKLTNNIPRYRQLQQILFIVNSANSSI